MSAQAVIVEFAVGEQPAQVSLAEAEAIATAAETWGIAAIRLLDRAGDLPALDPSVVAAHLAGRHPGIGWLVDAPTTHNAPYNLARRIASINRATAAGAGVTLLAGLGDEVSDAVTDRDATDAAQRWFEYAEILTRLWDSFPAAALLGDQQRAVVVDDALIRPIDFTGRYYRVAGPLDGPVHERPVLVAAQSSGVGWAGVAAVADAVIVDIAELGPRTTQLLDTLSSRGGRDDVAVLARVTEAGAVGDDPDADGYVLAPAGGATEILRAIEALEVTPSVRNLRAALGLPVSGRVSA